MDVLDNLYELYQAKTITILWLYYTGMGEGPVYYYSSHERGLNTFKHPHFVLKQHLIFYINIVMMNFY